MKNLATLVTMEGANLLTLNRDPSWQKPILNFTPRGKFWPQVRICLTGVNFVPWVWIYPLGVKFSVCPSILQNSRECSPLGAKVTPRGEVIPWGPGVKLRMASGAVARVRIEKPVVAYRKVSYHRKSSTYVQIWLQHCHIFFSSKFYYVCFEVEA
jgi:hypothetical protein